MHGSRYESQQENKCLIGGTVEEKLYTSWLKHSGQFISGETGRQNEPNQENQWAQDGH